MTTPVGKALAPAKAWDICLLVEREIYDPYRDNRVATLLLGTAAQESGLYHRRQIGMEGWRGAFGLWQLERGSVQDSIKRINASPSLCDRVLSLCGYSLLEPITRGDWQYVLDAMTHEGGDILSCAFARLHYCRVKAPIPANVINHAQYWKDHYNTRLGSGTVEQYRRAWQSLCYETVLSWKHSKQSHQS